MCMLGDSGGESRLILSQKSIRSTFAFPTDVCSETCIPIAQLVMSFSSVAAVGGLIFFFFPHPQPSHFLTFPCPSQLEELDRPLFFFPVGSECNSSWKCEPQEA